MTMPNTIDIDDPETATQQYESLRANALGELNNASGLNVFLRFGMSFWLHSLSEHDDNPPIIRKPLSAIARANSKIPGAELSSILVDAILNSSGIHKCLGARG
jgi:hypothetical protein